MQATISKLAEADAFGSLGCGRRQALWEALGPAAQRRQTWPLWDSLAAAENRRRRLPATTVQEEVLADYQTTGLSLRPHPLSFYRDQLQRLGVTDRGAAWPRCRTSRPVKVAGLVILRQRPSTGKGITFVTLEDETGIANLVLHIAIWERFHQVTRHSQRLARARPAGEPPRRDPRRRAARAGPARRAGPVGPSAGFPLSGGPSGRGQDNPTSIC